MLTKEIYKSLCERAEEYLKKANIVITESERAKMQVAEYNLGMPEIIGLELIEYVNTDRCCAKELILFPGQTCPEHRHPPVCGECGKEETFRCRFGEVYLYVEGIQNDAKNIKASLPSGKEDCFTAFHEIVLKPGQQYTIAPNTLHWFQAGDLGAVVSEFSTKSRDEFDIYTDPNINAAQDRTV